MFPTSTSCTQCMEAMGNANPEKSPDIHMVRFLFPGAEDTAWFGFSVLLYPTDLEKHMMDFWRDSGKIMTPRHAEYCSENMHLMATDSLNSAFRTPAPEPPHHSPSALLPWRDAVGDNHAVQLFIADLVTSEQAGQPKVDAADVFLYPTGMTAIYTLSEALASLSEQPVGAAFGWMYLEIVDLLRRGPWTKVLPFRDTTESAFDALEELLQSGQQLHVLFCELPSSVKLECPNLERIQALAVKYDFIVACDETMGNFINIDVLPYVDVVMSSLTKMFSGAADVMGGSLVLNPGSRYYKTIRSAVEKYHEDIYFPRDLSVLRKNSADVRERVQRSNETTLAILDLFTSHPAIEQTWFPSLVHSAACYEKLKRKNGGYGNTIIVIFLEAVDAARFYNSLGCYKAASFGTNFTMAVPYGELTYSTWDLERCRKYGVPKHMIRMNIGLEDERLVRQWITDALGQVLGYVHSDGVELGPKIARYCRST
ncbi:pyridoxal phosphate-dependent transferase [Aspergillus californicus]